MEVEQVQSRAKYVSATGGGLSADERAPRRFASGRVCGERDCGTELSVYNDGYFCSLHAPRDMPRVRARKANRPPAPSAVQP